MDREKGSISASAERKPLTLGSLFDGSGGFPLAGELAGIKPIWNCEVEPFAVAVTSKRFPNVKHYGDVSAMNGAEVEPVDIITWGSPCFPSGTLVLTDKGYVEIENVHVGMKVLTHMGRWRKVTATGSKEGETIVLRGNHYGLECTPNHPIYSAKMERHYPRIGNGKRGCHRKIGDEKEWSAAEKMVGKLWAVPNIFEAIPIEQPICPLGHREKPMPTFSKDFFYLVGRWLGDGWVRDNQRTDRPEGQTWSQIVICAGHEKEDVLKSAVEAVIDKYNVERCRTVVKYKFYGGVLCRWLTGNFGKYSYGKRIPSWTYSMPKEWRIALLKGICDTDGYMMKSGHMRITTVSKKLAHGIRLLAETLGYSSTVHLQHRPSTYVIEGRTVSQRDYYTIVLTRSVKRSRLSDSLHTWYHVRGMRKTGETKTVYNITVEDDNSYVADDIVVHNCQDLSVAGKRAGLEGSRSGLYVEAVRIVREMLEATDREYPKFCVFENVPGLLSSRDGNDFISCLDMMQELGFLPDANILDAQFMGVPQRRKRVFITWVQADYILRKRTPLSDSIILQFLTEILQINLAGLLRAYGVGLKKSAARKYTDAGDGVRRRMYLFSLHKEGRLRMLQERLEEIKATLSNGQSTSDSNHGNGQTAEIMSTAEVTRSESSTMGNQSWSIGQLLKSALEDSLLIENGFTTLTWTKETIARKICTCFQGLLNTLDATMNLMLSSGKEPMSLNCFEWVLYILTEIKEFIDETKKHERGVGQVAWHDMLWSFEQELQGKGEQIERYFGEVCGHEVLPESEGLSGYTPQGFRSWERTAGNPPQCAGTASCGSGDGRVILDDQGGSVIGVSKDVTPTLRAQTHGHPPCVVDEEAAECEWAAGFLDRNSADARSIGYEEERSPTLCAGVVPAVVPLENHPSDSRIRIEESGKIQTLSGRMGTGGNNVPLLMEEQPGMRQQTYVLQGNMIGRDDKNGPQGCGVSEDVCYTLTDVDRHAVAAPDESVYAMTTGSFMEVSAEKAPTLKARDYKDPTAVAPVPMEEDPCYGIDRAAFNQGRNAKFGFSIEEELSPTLVSRGPNAVSKPETHYTVRRLTPTECARLQGFPDWWCHELGNPNPTDEEVAFWMDVWETHRRVVTHASKPKTEKQVRKWLADPYSDAAEYKLWGNGVALPCVHFVMCGIVWAAGGDR